jgi:hypothetical protein
VTALNSPIPIAPPRPQRGIPVDDFVDRLSRPTPAKSTGPFFTAVLSLISLGLLPLVIWPTRWAEFLDEERHDLLELIQWWRRRVDPTDAARLDKIARKLRPRPMLIVLPWLAVSFNIILMAMRLAQGDTLQTLWNITFKHARYLPDRTPVYAVWILTLSIAYGLHWFAVVSHTSAVRRLMHWTNRLARDNHFVRIQISALAAGIGPGWIIVAILLCFAHAWWAIPMALAGGLQRRYCMQSSPVIRIALARQARDAFAIVQSGGDHFCFAGHCGTRLPAQAKFCPRCGTASDIGKNQPG